MAILAADIAAKCGMAENAASGNGRIIAAGESGTTTGWVNSGAVQLGLWRIACARPRPWQSSDRYLFGNTSGTVEK
ncbi:hypothetical protein D3C79_936600 [compost metagenome]